MNEGLFGHTQIDLYLHTFKLLHLFPEKDSEPLARVQVLQLEIKKKKHNNKYIK